MYKLVIYGLFSLVVYTFLLSLLGYIYYGIWPLLLSLSVILIVSFGLNKIFAILLKVPLNPESVYITAFILFFILFPSTETEDILITVLATTIAIGSKFLIAPNKRHIFNPAAFGVFAIGIFGFGNSFWWVGSMAMFPATLIIGLLIVRKIRKVELFLAFICTSITMLLLMHLSGLRVSEDIVDSLVQMFTSGPLIFLGSIMLTEPLTMPPRKRFQIAYAVLVGILSNISFSFGPIFLTPELALLLGNIFSYLVSFKHRIILKLNSINEIAKDTFEFSFIPDKRLSFIPGQFMEWTLPHSSPDNRGVRRFFTISSASTEPEILLGIKYSNPPSTFKRTLRDLNVGDTIVAGSVAGDFVLPKDPSEELVFIAGGIGSTPFRSMLKYLIDKGEKRSITFFYTIKSPDEIAYKDILEKAEVSLGAKIHFVVTDTTRITDDWTGKKGFLTEEMIREEVPKIHEAKFYLSGPNAMVESYKKLLKTAGVKTNRIVTDYFPGF